MELRQKFSVTLSPPNCHCNSFTQTGKYCEHMHAASWFESNGSIDQYLQEQKGMKSSIYFYFLLTSGKIDFYVPQHKGTTKKSAGSSTEESDSDSESESESNSNSESDSDSSSEDSGDEPTKTRRHHPLPIIIEDIKEPTLTYEDEDVGMAMENHLKKLHFLVPESVDAWKSSSTTSKFFMVVLYLLNITYIVQIGHVGRPKAMQTIRHKKSVTISKKVSLNK